MATITAASRKPLRAAGARTRDGAGWGDTFAVRTEPFIGKCLNLSANAAREQSRGTTRPPRGTSRPDCKIMERHAARLRVAPARVVVQDLRFRWGSCGKGAPDAGRAASGDTRCRGAGSSRATLAAARSERQAPGPWRRA